MLEKGHHQVKLDDEAWDRLYTWIDLNVPDHGTWTETEQHGLDAGKLRDIARRKKMNRQVAYLDEDYEFVPHLPAQAIAFVKPPPEEPVPTQEIKADGWPFDAAEAKHRQSTAGLPPELRIDLGSGQRDGPSLGSRGRVRYGRPGRLCRRTSSDEGADQEAVLYGEVRDD